MKMYTINTLHLDSKYNYHSLIFGLQSIGNMTQKQKSKICLTCTKCKKWVKAVVIIENLLDYKRAVEFAGWIDILKIQFGYVC